MWDAPPQQRRCCFLRLATPRERSRIVAPIGCILPKASDIVRVRPRALVPIPSSPIVGHEIKS